MIIFQVWLGILSFILFFIIFFIFLSLFMNVAFTSAMIFEWRLAFLFKRIFSFRNSWYLTLLFLSQVWIHFTRSFIFILIIISARNSFLHNIKFGSGSISTFFWLYGFRIKHLIELLLTSYLFSNLHLTQSSWLYAYKLILFAGLYSFQIVLFLFFWSFFLKTFILFFPLNSE